jgi:hypothetical protein
MKIASLTFTLPDGKEKSLSSGNRAADRLLSFPSPQGEASTATKKRLNDKDFS